MDLQSPELRNVIPLIISFIKYDNILLLSMKQWLLINAIFYYGYEYDIFNKKIKKKYVNLFSLCYDPFNNNSKIERIVQTNNDKQYFLRSFSLHVRGKVTDFDQKGFPKKITRLAYYLDYLIRSQHIDLLNRIYDNGIKDNKKFNISEYDIEIFKLLPNVFQKIINNYNSERLN